MTTTGWPAAGLASVLYLGEECAAGRTTNCGVVEVGTLTAVCSEVATICVHVFVGPEPRMHGRTALCEPHSLQAYSVAVKDCIERMHSMDAS